MVVCSIPVLLGISCSRVGPSMGVNVDPAFRTLIAPDTKVLAGAAIDRLKSTPLYQRHKDALNFPLLDASAERLNLDPRRDVSDLLGEWNGTRAAFLAKGRFNSQDVERRLTTLGAEPTKVGKYSLFGVGENSLAFLGKGMAVEGSTERVRQIIHLEEKGNGEVPEELQERLRALPRAVPIWLVSRGGLPFADMPMRSDYTSALSNIVGYVKGVSIGVRADSGAHLTADLTCTSVEGATRVHDGLKAAVALGRLTTRDDQADLLKIYDAIQVDQDQALVHIHADFAPELADQVMERLPKISQDMRALRH